MNGQVFRTELLTFVGTKRKVQLRCSTQRQEFHDGFVLGVGRDLIWLQQFTDFQPDGYEVLRLSDIANIRSDENERMWERMLAGEGILERVKIPYELPLQDMPELLRALQSLGENIIVECTDNSRNGFYIGRILFVDELSLLFATFDPLGHWDSEPEKIYFHKITRIQFETPYCQTYSKYLEGPCPHSSGPPLDPRLAVFPSSHHDLETEKRNP